MITQRALNYAKILYSLEVQEDSIKATENLLTNVGELMEVLENPAIGKQEKASVIDALFEKDIRSFLKMLCENNTINLFPQIMDAYEELVLNHKNILKAKLTYASEPKEDEINQIKNMLCDKYDKTGVLLELEEDTSLIGGFVLHVGDMEYDKSIKGTLSEMQKTLIRR